MGWQTVVATLLENIEEYDQMRRVLETQHLGKWVVFYDRELVKIDESFQTVAEFAVVNYGRGPYLIRQVGAPPITLPSSAIYHPTYPIRNARS